MKDDARRLGCRCDVCPLREEPGPVLPEARPQAPLAVVGDFPGDVDVRETRPFTGPSGRLLLGLLSKAGVTRGSLHLTTSILCQPPGNDIPRMIARIRSVNAERRKQNTQRVKAGQDPVPLLQSPFDCCRPRLASELAGRNYALVAGSQALGSVLGGQPSISALRGSLIEGDLLYDPDRNVMGVGSKGAGMHPIHIIPILSPGQVQRQPRWMDTLRRDVERMVRWMQGRLTWKDPEIIYHPSPEVLRSFLFSGRLLAYDVETDGIEPLSANIRCIGIGDSSTVMVVGTRPKDADPTVPGDFGFYPEPVMAQIKSVLREWFTAPNVLKVGHNAGYYDRMVIRRWLGVDPHPTLDTILLHRLAESELPHSLGFVGSKYTDVHAWKADRSGKKLATGAESDHELHHYCALDVCVTARVVPNLNADVRRVGQDSLVAKDHLVQRVCADMHEVGMYVNQELRHKTEIQLIEEVVSLRKRLQDQSNQPDFNPGSTHKLRRLLFEDWKLSPPLDDAFRFTSTGDPSTSDDVMRSLLSLDKLPKPYRDFILILRKYRKVMKELGTYVVKLRPMTMNADLGDDEDDDDEIKAEREERGYTKRGIVWADGRMRPGYNAHVTVTGRLSSSSPINAQNFPKHLRKLIVPQPGHVLVGADADQLELRIAAARWQLAKYIEAFDQGIDPHSMVTAQAIFGKEFMRCNGWPSADNGNKWQGDAYNYRQLAKIIQYAFQYKATVETGTRIIQSTEVADPDTGGTKMPYLQMSVRDVRQMRNAWLAGVPELEKGWDKEIQFFRDNQFIQEPVHGRKRYCLDGENPNEIVNFPIQGSASALINDAMIAIWQDIPLHRWGHGTGLLTQTHDALVVECPEDKANEVKEIIEHHMNKYHPDLPGVKFTATADKGYSWKEVG